MAIQIGTVRDHQSAEYLKTLALGEENREQRLVHLAEAQRLDPDNTTVVSHLAFGLLDARDQPNGGPRAVIDLLMPIFPRHPRLIHQVNLFAVALLEEAYFDAALKLFEHCQSLDHEYPSLAENMRIARSNTSRSRSASSELKMAIETGIIRANAVERPTLAVCMIVKNEEEFIADALSSVSKIADEMIVVDTGSTDRTVELSEAGGARVSFFEWTGDFAAARNTSLDGATADWILVLDADERLTDDSRTSLRAVMEEYQHSEDLMVVCVKIRNFTRGGQFLNDGFSGRLFKRHPVMRFEGRVHEEVARGRPDVSMDYRLDVVFDHFGADPEVMREKAKDERNIELLEARIAEKPEDLLTWFYLASQHWTGGRRTDAMDAFRRVIMLFERNPSSYGVAIRNVPVPYSYVGLVRALADQGDSAEAVEIARRGLGRFPDNPDLWFQLGWALLGAEDLDAGKDAFERAASIKVSGYALISMHDRRIGEWRARKMVGDVEFAQENIAAAYENYTQVFQALPDGLEDKVVIAARLVEAASSMKRFDALPRHTLDYLMLRPGEMGVALQVAQQVAGAMGLEVAYDLMQAVYEQVPATREDHQLLVSLGQIAEQAGDEAVALQWYKSSAEIGNPDPRFWLSLAQLCLKHGEAEFAAGAFETAQRLMAEASQSE